METLRRAMEAKGLTAADLAAATGLTEHTIKKRLQNGGKWNLGEAVKVADTLGGTVETLFFEGRGKQA